MKLPKSTVPDGYNLKIEYTNDVKSFDIKKVQLHLEPEQETGYIKGELLAERMKKKGLSANVLDYLLKHTELIPNEWKFKCIFFWGTVFRRSDGDLCVRYLFWDDGTWAWSDYWLGVGWHSGYPAAVLVSTQNLDTQSSLEPLSLDLAIEIVKKSGYKVIKEI